MKRHGASKGHRPPFAPCRLISKPSTKLEEQSGFADSGFANNKDYLSMAGLRFLKTVGKYPKFSLASDERGESALGSHLKAGPSDAGGDHIPGLDWLGLPFKR
jgi:hypothetical protein